MYRNVKRSERKQHQQQPNSHPIMEGFLIPEASLDALAMHGVQGASANTTQSINSIEEAIKDTEAAARQLISSGTSSSFSFNTHEQERLVAGSVMSNEMAQQFQKMNVSNTYRGSSTSKEYLPTHHKVYVPAQPKLHYPQRGLSFSGGMRPMHVCTDKSSGIVVSNTVRTLSRFDFGAKRRPKPHPLLGISRTPVKCPVNFCSRSIGMTSLLAHYLRDHGIEFSMEEIDSRSTIEYNISFPSLPFNYNYCLGLLVYAGTVVGKSNRVPVRPAERFLCMHNAFLPTKYANLRSHLPILVVACKTSWASMIDNKDIQDVLTDSLQLDQLLLAIWLVSAPTTTPLWCTMTVYNLQNEIARSCIVKVRTFDLSQDAFSFMATDPNVMRLSMAEVKNLTNKFELDVHIEIIVNDFEDQAKISKQAAH